MLQEASHMEKTKQLISGKLLSTAKVNVILHTYVASIGVGEECWEEAHTYTHRLPALESVKNAGKKRIHGVFYRINDGNL